jgi:hypothetical protein
MPAVAGVFRRGRRNTREGALSIAPYEVIAFMESVV